MPVFEFILLIVLITTLGKVAMAVGVPMVDKLGDVARELAARKERDASPSLPPEVLEELETRMARIEDRLDFIEELKAPDHRRALGEGPSGAPTLDRGGPGADPGREPAGGAS